MEKKEKDNEYVDFVVTARKYKTTLTAKYKNRKMWHKFNKKNYNLHLN